MQRSSLSQPQLPTCDQRQNVYLTNELDKLRHHHSGTDLQIKCNGGIIHAHKLILRASCPYFERLFSTENHSAARLESFDAELFARETVEIVITYLYTGKIPNLNYDFESLKELIQICHLMDLKNLSSFVWNYLTGKLTLNTFVQVWVLVVDCRLDKNENLRNFATQNLELICDLEDLHVFSFDHVRQLINIFDKRSCCDSCVKIVFKWTNCCERERLAVKLVLEDINLTYLSDNCLKYLLENTYSAGTLVNVLTTEAISRLG